MAQSVWEMNFKDNVSSAVRSMEKMVGSAFNTMSNFEKQFDRDTQSAAHSTHGLSGSLREAAHSSNSFSSSVKEAAHSSDALSSGLMHVAEVAASAFAVERVYEFGKELLHTTAEFEGFGNIIKYASVDAVDGQKNMDYLGDAIHRLHLPMKQAYEQFSELQGGLYGTGVEGDKLRHVFEGVAEASTVLHMSADQFSRTGYAIKEIGELGTLQTRQMRMLAMALPGAMNLAAQSMKMSTSQFHEAMESGSITAAAFLPRFAQQLKDHFGAGLGNAGNSLVAKMNDTSTALYEREVELGEKLKPFYISVMGELINVISAVGDVALKVVDFLKEYWDVIKLVGEAVGFLVGWYLAYNSVVKLSAGITWALGIADVALWTIQQLLAGATLESAMAMWGLNTAMLANPVFWLIGGVMALTGGIIYAWNHFEKFRVLMYALWATIKQVFSNIGDFFKMIFEPIFKAIDAFKKGDYAEAGKQVGIMAFNLTPVGMAVQTTKFALEGGFTKGIPEAWAQGKKDGHKSWADAHPTGAHAIKSPEMPAGYNAAAGGSEGSGKEKGEGKPQRNVTVTIQKLVGIENVYVQKLEDAGSRAGNAIKEIMIGGVRDFETGVAADA